MSDFDWSNMAGGLFTLSFKQGGKWRARSWCQCFELTLIGRFSKSKEPMAAAPTTYHEHQFLPSLRLLQFVENAILRGKTERALLIYKNGNELGPAGENSKLVAAANLEILSVVWTTWFWSSRPFLVVQYSRASKYSFWRRKCKNQKSTSITVTIDVDKRQMEVALPQGWRAENKITNLPKETLLQVNVLVGSVDACTLLCVRIKSNYYFDICALEFLQQFWEI